MWLKFVESAMSNDFERQIDRIIHIITQLYSQTGQPVVIGVVASYGKGISAGAGKSILTQKIKSTLDSRLGEQCAVINTDAFLLKDKSSKKDLASRMLYLAVKSLKNGKNINIPGLYEQSKYGTGAELSEPYDINEQQVNDIYNQLYSNPDLQSLIDQHQITPAHVQTLMRMRDTDQSIGEFIGSEQLPEDYTQYASEQIKNIQPGFTSFKDYGSPVRKTGEESQQIAPEKYIIVEGVGIYPVYSELDIIVVGAPDEKEAQRGYALRWAAYKCQEYYIDKGITPTREDISSLLALGWLGAKRQPASAPMTSLIKSDFINRFVPDADELGFEKSIEQLDKLGKVIIIKDYSPSELHKDLNDDNEIQDFEYIIDEVDRQYGEMVKDVKVENPTLNTDFNQSHKTLSKTFTSARYPSEEEYIGKLQRIQDSIDKKTRSLEGISLQDKINRINDDIEKLKEELNKEKQIYQYLKDNKLFKAPIFKGGSNNIYITGGLNRDAIAQSGREPQDFDLLYTSSNNIDPELELNQFVQWIKENPNSGISNVEIRKLRKGKSLILTINNIKYAVDMKAIKNELEVVSSLMAQTNFTINCFYRKLSDHDDQLNITDISGKGTDDIRDRIIRWTPSHDFSYTDATNSQNAVSAFLNLMKMANLARYNEETKSIDGLFTFDREVSIEINRVMENNFPNLPAWRAKYTLEREVPEELERITDPRIRSYFVDMINSHPFFARLREKARE